MCCIELVLFLQVLFSECYCVDPEQHLCVKKVEDNNALSLIPCNGTSCYSEYHVSGQISKGCGIQRFEVGQSFPETCHENGQVFKTSYGDTVYCCVGFKCNENLTAERLMDDSSGRLDSAIIQAKAETKQQNKDQNLVWLTVQFL
uniref:UPAR/Ly6 domain-containing protein n=1 Tax=Syphacia muris TaxID=451379 RepID=A0A0N5ASR7_9BILA